MAKDDFDGLGGRYRRDKDGTRERIDFTEDHPDGNKARDAKGRPIAPQPHTASRRGEPPAKDTPAPKAKK